MVSASKAFWWESFTTRGFYRVRDSELRLWSVGPKQLKSLGSGGGSGGSFADQLQPAQATEVHWEVAQPVKNMEGIATAIVRQGED